MKRNHFLAIMLLFALLLGGCAVQRDKYDTKDILINPKDAQEKSAEITAPTEQPTQTPDSEMTPPFDETPAVEAAAPTGDAASNSAISEDDAKALALAKVPGATAADIRKFKTEYDDGRMEYEGEILYGGMEYEFEIDAQNGTFLSWETETSDKGSAATNSAISEDDAKALALAKVPGATAADIRKFKTEYDDGRMEYEGEILYGGIEYEFEIDAQSGAFLSWEADYDD